MAAHLVSAAEQGDGAVVAVTTPSTWPVTMAPTWMRR
jgi:hypothetical protein